MKQFFNSLTSSSVVNYINTYGDISITNYLNSGVYGTLSTPATLFHNGCTYIVGYKNNTTNHQALIFKYDGASVTSNTVGTGTVTKDAYNHPHPSIMIQDDYIYVFQVNTHADPIDVWKSDAKEDITSFTKIDQIPGKFSYPSVRMFDPNTMLIFSRESDTTDGTNEQYSLSYVKSLPNNFTSWTFQPITVSDHSTSTYRHYPATPHRVGNNTIWYMFANLRREVSNTYWRISLMKSTDLITWKNADETYSFTTTPTTGIPADKVENECMVNTAAIDTEIVGTSPCIQINDVLYWASEKPTDRTTLIISKLVGTVITEVEFPATFALSNTTPLKMYYKNGSLFYRVKEDGESVFKIMKSDLNLTTFTTVYTFTNPYTFSIPDNYEETTGTIMVGGGNEADVFNYLLTNEL